jgi:hypothetical protein
MVYLSTFILTLFLTQIARAQPPACHDPITPESLNPDTEYNLQIPSPLRATFDQTFDNPQGSLNGVACSNGDNGLAAKYPNFSDLPTFPYIGGAYDIAWNSPNCGGCWLITNPANGDSVYITAIDTAGAGFNIAQVAYKQLNGGELGGGLNVVAKKVNRGICGL